MNSMATPSSILPPDTLKGQRVGVSVSQSPDLARLGLTESHLRLALGEIARTVLVLGGGLAYGGHLDPAGYTVFLMKELTRFARRDRPLLVCLAWSEHRRMTLTQLTEMEKDLGLYGEIIYLTPDGKAIKPDDGRHGDAATPELDANVVTAGLTALRGFMTARTRGRILVGGKRHGFQGAMPGLVEEAIIALEAGQPVFLAGGFGGVTLDIIRALEPDHAAWLEPYAPAESLDARYVRGLARLESIIKTKHWKGIDNGLSADENRLLAATHRASEIATLVSLGLGRMAGMK